MLKQSPNDLIGRIEVLLEKEHKALVSGELDALAELLQQKQTLVEALSVTPISGARTLKSLQAKAIRNQAMLESATKGIKTVASRLATVQTVRRNLETYDADGKKRTIRSNCKASLEKRA